MKDHNIMVSGWYSYSSNPNLKYGLCNGSARVPNEERRVYNKKWMDPEITIPADDIHIIHVEAFLYILTRWATVLSWKQQIQNGTNFEQGKIYSSRHSAKRKNYDRGKKQF